ncbi:MAG: hypothetical protein Q7T05_02015 [Dehalococcoidia bacterium]|nr:hypothetical protein [Dehalococcoidia bacterium]
MKNEHVLAPGGKAGGLVLTSFDAVKDEWACVCYCGLHVRAPAWAILEGAGSCAEVSRKVDGVF